MIYGILAYLVCGIAWALAIADANAGRQANFVGNEPANVRVLSGWRLVHRAYLFLMVILLWPFGVAVEVAG